MPQFARPAVQSHQSALSFPSDPIYIPTLNRLRLQFFIAYAVVGSFMPLLSLYLREAKGISDFQFSIAMACMSASHLFSPSLFTLLADLKIDPRHVLAGALGIGTAALLTLHQTTSPTLAIALVAIYGLAQVAMFPLMDGFFFSSAEDVKRSGADPPPLRRCARLGHRRLHHPLARPLLPHPPERRLDRLNPYPRRRPLRHGRDLRLFSSQNRSPHHTRQDQTQTPHH